MFKKHGWKVSLLVTAGHFLWDVIGHYQQVKELDQDTGGMLTALLSPWTGLAVTIVLLLWAKDYFPHRYESKNSAAIDVTVASGTARMGPSGLVAKRSADVIVNNSGAPFSLVAHARLRSVAPGFEWSENDQWEFEPRLLKGGVAGKTWYHMATVEPDDSGWVVGVRAEHMVVIRRWQSSVPLWFDIEWTFYNEVDATLHLIKKVIVAVDLTEDHNAFDVEIRTSGEPRTAGVTQVTGSQPIVAPSLVNNPPVEPSNGVTPIASSDLNKMVNEWQADVKKLLDASEHRDSQQAVTLPVVLKWGGSTTFKVISRSTEMLPGVRVILADARRWVSAESKWVQSKETHPGGAFQQTRNRQG